MPAPASAPAGRSCRVHSVAAGAGDCTWESGKMAFQVPPCCKTRLQRGRAARCPTTNRIRPLVPLSQKQADEWEHVPCSI